MTAEQYWYGDPWWAEGYREAQNIITERRNHEAWLQGFYILDAMQVVAHNAMSKKGTKPRKYMDAVRITPLTEDEKKKKIADDRKKVIKFFTAFQKKFKSEEDDT